MVIKLILLAALILVGWFFLSVLINVVIAIWPLVVVGCVSFSIYYYLFER